MRKASRRHTIGSGSMQLGLDRDIALQLRVALPVDLSHPAFAGQATDFRGTELYPDG